MAGGIRRLIFTNKSIYNFNKYVPGSGVGALNISTRRYLNQHATPFRAIKSAPSPAPLIPCSVYDNNLKIYPLTIINEGGVYIINAEVTDQLGSGSLGLMGRTYLPPNDGMMFIYNIPIKASFWNKDTPIPLDIAFINCSGTILEIFHMAANDETIIESTFNVSYALEVNEGWFAARNIIPGMKVYG
jgi:uncharacterized protein